MCGTGSKILQFSVNYLVIDGQHWYQHQQYKSQLIYFIPCVVTMVTKAETQKRTVSWWRKNLLRGIIFVTAGCLELIENGLIATWRIRSFLRCLVLEEKKLEVVFSEKMCSFWAFGEGNFPFVRKPDNVSENEYVMLQLGYCTVSVPNIKQIEETVVLEFPSPCQNSGQREITRKTQLKRSNSVWTTKDCW